MLSYTYRPLDRQQNEIRLVELLPGERVEPVRMSIYQASFEVPLISPVSLPPIQDVQKTLTPQMDCQVHTRGKDHL